MTVVRNSLRERVLKLWLPLGVSLVFALFPFYWMAITSLKPNQELYNRKTMPLIVHDPTLKHYVDLLTETSFLEWTWNTFVVAAIWVPIARAESRTSTRVPPKLGGFCWNGRGGPPCCGWNCWVPPWGGMGYPC